MRALILVFLTAFSSSIFACAAEIHDAFRMQKEEMFWKELDRIQSGIDFTRIDVWDETDREVAEKILDKRIRQNLRRSIVNNSLNYEMNVSEVGIATSEPKPKPVVSARYRSFVGEEFYWENKIKQMFRQEYHELALSGAIPDYISLGSSGIPEVDLAVNRFESPISIMDIEAPPTGPSISNYYPNRLNSFGQNQQSVFRINKNDIQTFKDIGEHLVKRTNPISIAIDILLGAETISEDQ